MTLIRPVLVRGEAGAPTPMLAGVHDDEFIRENGEWKILRNKAGRIGVACCPPAIYKFTVDA